MADVEADFQNDANSRMQNTRRIKSVLIKPQSQLKYAFFLFGGGLLMLVILLSYLLLSFNESLENLHAVAQIDSMALDHLQLSLLSLVMMTLISGVVLAALTFSVGIVISHRIFGPAIPFQRHVQSLINGDYKSRVRLRKKDEFQELASSMNQLAEQLEKQNAS